MMTQDHDTGLGTKFGGGGESLIFRGIRPQNKILQFSGGLRVFEFIKKERGKPLRNIIRYLKQKPSSI